MAEYEHISRRDCRSSEHRADFLYCAQKWASNEQKGMSAASATVAEAMAKGNQDYESKMGFR
jgi:hypothetical protein